jgi:hypothetical protein
MKSKNELLFEIWEYVDSKNVLSTAEETEYVKIIAECEEDLSLVLDEEGVVLFNRLRDSLSELNYIDRRNAFIEGIKFATQYIFEALENN